MQIQEPGSVFDIASESELADGEGGWMQPMGWKRSQPAPAATSSPVAPVVLAPKTPTLPAGAPGGAGKGTKPEKETKPDDEPALEPSGSATGDTDVI